MTKALGEERESKLLGQQKSVYVVRVLEGGKIKGIFVLSPFSIEQEEM